MEKVKLTENNLNKKQPSNLEAEQALLGSILVNNDIIDEVSNIVNPTTRTIHTESRNVPIKMFCPLKLSCKAAYAPAPRMVYGLDMPRITCDYRNSPCKLTTPPPHCLNPLDFCPCSPKCS